MGSPGNPEPCCPLRPHPWGCWLPPELLTKGDERVLFPLRALSPGFQLGKGVMPISQESLMNTSLE